MSTTHWNLSCKRLCVWVYGTECRFRGPEKAAARSRFNASPGGSPSAFGLRLDIAIKLRTSRQGKRLAVSAKTED